MASQLYNYTPNQLQELLDSSSSYKEVLRKLNMCDHGANYDTLKKIIDEYKLDLTIITKNRSELNKELLYNLHGSHRKTLEEIFVENSTYTHGNNIKKKLFEYGLKQYVCEYCGLSEWLGEPIPLQVHHENGIHNDNRLENIKLICPNCHALTDTFAGKNIDRSKQKKKEKKKRVAKKGISEDGKRLYDGYGNYKVLCPVCKIHFMNKEATQCRECYKKEQRKPKITKEELFNILKTNSYTSAGSILGVDKDTVSRWHKYYVNEENQRNDNEVKIIGSDKAPSRDVLKAKIRTMSFVQIGKEYDVSDNSVRRWCDTYNLPRQKTKIINYSDEEWKQI